jgi:tetratricopeptide (TPR) repeat protein
MHQDKILFKSLLIFSFCMALIWVYLSYNFNPTGEDRQSSRNFTLLPISLTKPQKTKWEKIWETLEQSEKKTNIVKNLAAYKDNTFKDALNEESAKFLVAEGDTYFMRHQYSFIRVPKDVTRVFQASNLLTERKKIRKLQEFGKDLNPIVQYRALLEIARTSLTFPEKKDRNQAKETLDKAIQIKGIPVAWHSDIYYLLGVYYTLKREYKKALIQIDEAIRLDQVFVDAYWLKMKVLLNLAHNNQKIFKSNTLLNTAAELLDCTNSIVRILNNTSLFTDIAMDLQDTTAGSFLKDLVLGYCYFYAGNYDLANSHARATISGLSILSASNQKAILEKVNLLITRMKND